MNRTRTLLIIGVFMLSLAVLAALEFRVQDEPPSEGQMVTGSLSKDMPALPKLPSLGDSEGNKGGVLVPLDNGTLRGSAAPLDMSAIPPDEETAPAGKDTPETAAPAADPAVSAEKPAPAPMGEIAPADTFTEKRKQPVAEEKAPQQEKKAEKAVAEKPAEKPQPKVSEPKQEKEQAKEGVVVLTTKAPAKLAAGQTAITATRQECSLPYDRRGPDQDQDAAPQGPQPLCRGSSGQLGHPAPARAQGSLDFGHPSGTP